jgi:hypothetical protein
VSTEDAVIRAVAWVLMESGFSIEQTRTALEHGIDLVAVRQAPPKYRLLVEAKGDGSSKAGTLAASVPRSIQAKSSTMSRKP